MYNATTYERARLDCYENFLENDIFVDNLQGGEVQLICKVMIA